MLALTDAGFAAAVAEKLAARDPDRYGPAALQLRTRADRVLQRQKEQRRHEKNLRRGKRTPWAPPPPKEKGRPEGTRDRRRSEQGPPRTRGSSSGEKLSAKRGPGGRRLTGKFRHS